MAQGSRARLPGTMYRAPTTARQRSPIAMRACRLTHGLGDGRSEQCPYELAWPLRVGRWRKVSRTCLRRQVGIEERFLGCVRRRLSQEARQTEEETRRTALPSCVRGGGMTAIDSEAVLTTSRFVA